MTRSFLLMAPLLALPAFAQDAPVIADTDGNGLWSLTELQTVYIDLTEDAFSTADTNKDGGLDTTELAAGLESGVIKPVQM